MKIGLLIAIIVIVSGIVGLVLSSSQSTNSERITKITNFQGTCKNGNIIGTSCVCSGYTNDGSICVGGNLNGTTCTCS